VVSGCLFNGKNDSQKKRRPADSRCRPDAWRKVQGRKKRGNTKRGMGTVAVLAAKFFCYSERRPRMTTE